MLLAQDVRRFLERPAGASSPVQPAIPPGAPIGEPALDFLRHFAPLCSSEACCRN
jgi:hypothetical protein